MDSQGVELVSLQYEDLSGPDFSADPGLVKIPAAAGVIELVKKIPSFSMRELVKTEFNGKLALMITELSSLLKEVSFYKLSPGRLEEMIGCVEALP